jgi:CubicO group peptidase (beta-lactamase class C family)
VKIDADAAGLDETRLARLDDHLVRRYLEPGKIAGCQVVVARNGHVGHFRSLGAADRERDKPVADDTIFRIFSMSKPVTGVALLSLYEQGHFQLNDPIHRFLPELADLKVRERDDNGEPRLVDPHRPVSVRDVLMHTSGFGYDALLGPGSILTDAPAGRAGAETDDGASVSGFLRPSTFSLADLIGRLAERPLHFHPGTRWLYSVSTDVCSRLVEVISGQPFDEYLRTTLFEPLGMHDTGFSVPDDKIDRFAAMYRRGRGKVLTLAEDPYSSRFRTPPAMLSGGGGLVSTTADYLRFCQMLLNGGELDGVRILGRKTVEAMTLNHLPGGVALSEVARGYGEVGFNGMGFGLTVAVSQGPAATGVVGSAGSYSWGGAASTIFWIDPIEDLITVFMVQFLPSGTFDFRSQLQTLVYAALTD